jgi:iron complex transport system ATP-binding protein
VILDVIGLEFRYNSRRILHDVRFALQPGELLAILGPNGVGKTTLLKCINATLRPKAGSVLVDGCDVLRMASMEIARRVGYVAQRTDAARLTVFDAVLLGRRPHLGWRVSEQDLRLTDAAIARLALGPLSMRHIDQLSGGELQKVAIARALVQEPRLLLLDEPTSSLDLRNQIDILKIIRQVADQHQVAAAMTMHDLNKALRWADKFILLKEGAVFAAGRPEEVTAEMVAAVYGVPVEIHLHRGSPWIIPLEQNGNGRT